MNELKQIEFWENHYLNQIEFTLTQDLAKMIDGLKSKDKIKEDWIEYFHRINKSKQNSDFARGAERIYYWLFNQFGIPNSSPIGADMFFETYNSFVHIDVKTSKINNPSDYKGRIPIGANQTSYKIDDLKFKVHLPTKYSYNEKLCLTYLINIVYSLLSENIEIEAIIIISVPNGKLKNTYGDKIIQAGKTGSSGKGFRYKFKDNPNFKLLDDNPKRIRIIYLSYDYKNRESEILGFNF